MHQDHGIKVIPADLMIKTKYSINNQNIIDTVNPTKNEPLAVE